MLLIDAGHLAVSMHPQTHVVRPDHPTDTGVSTTDERPRPTEREEITITVSSRTANRTWFKQWMEDAAELLNLPPNWNGYGERPVHASSLKRAARILDAMDYDGPPPSTAPRHDGSIQIEWHNGPRSVELVVLPHEPAEAWVFTEDEETTWAVTSNVDALRLRDAVTRLLGAYV